MGISPGIEFSYPIPMTGTSLFQRTKPAARPTSFSCR
jgi:hypothetical protein